VRAGTEVNIENQAGETAAMMNWELVQPILSAVARQREDERRKLELLKELCCAVSTGKVHE